MVAMKTFTALPVGTIRWHIDFSKVFIILDENTTFKVLKSTYRGTFMYSNSYSSWGPRWPPGPRPISVRGYNLHKKCKTKDKKEIIHPEVCGGWGYVIDSEIW